MYRWAFCAVAVLLAGCLRPVGPTCGNGVCETGETAACSDCDAGPFCGNGVCEAGETAACSDCAGGPTWSCDPAWYGTNDGCDCGCTTPDPDCGGGGCTGPGCSVAGCAFCWPSMAMGACGGGLPSGADCSSGTCAAGLLCVYDYFDTVPYCRPACSPDPACMTNTCAGSTSCTFLGNYTGVNYYACMPPHPEAAACGCDYGLCDANNLCVDITGTGEPNGWCFWQCATDTDCYPTEYCAPLSGGQSVCLPDDGNTPDTPGVCEAVCDELVNLAGLSSPCEFCSLGWSTECPAVAAALPFAYPFALLLCYAIVNYVCNEIAMDPACMDCGTLCDSL